MGRGIRALCRRRILESWIGGNPSSSWSWLPAGVGADLFWVREADPHPHRCHTSYPRKREGEIWVILISHRYKIYEQWNSYPPHISRWRTGETVGQSGKNFILDPWARGSPAEYCFYEFQLRVIIFIPYKTVSSRVRILATSEASTLTGRQRKEYIGKNWQARGVGNDGRWVACDHVANQYPDGDCAKVLYKKYAKGNWAGRSRLRFLLQSSLNQRKH